MVYTFKCRGIADFGEQVIPDANTGDIPGAEKYFERMWAQEILKDAPVFDSFFLQTTDRLRPETWEWIVQDIHDFTGGNVPITGWLISSFFKEILEQFIIVPPYHFYPAKLKFRGKKLDYYIFNLLWINLDEIIDFKKSQFYLKDTRAQQGEYSFHNGFENKDEYKAAKLNLLETKDPKLLPDKIVFKKYFDFVPLYGINADVIISKRLKDAIEMAKIEGVVIGEVGYKLEMPVLKE